MAHTTRVRVSVECRVSPRNMDVNMTYPMIRLAAFAILLPTAVTSAAQQVHPALGTIAEAVARLRPGEYVWESQVVPKGPLLLIVNLPTQRALLFRNGVPIAASTISTGRPGFETPTGVFTVLQKHVEHYSSRYDNAPMPYMQRLTWKGVALHGGNLPGHPASHGCIRLPKGFAKLLYGITTVGMMVVVTNRAATPRIAPTPEIVLRGAGASPGTGMSFQWSPERSQTGPVSIVVSARDGRAVVLRNGVEIGSAPVSVDGPVTGTWAYVLRTVDRGGQKWLRMELGPGDPAREVAATEWTRFNAPEAFRRAVASIVAPGTTIVVTPDSFQTGSTGAAVTVLDDEPERNR